MKTTNKIHYVYKITNLNPNDERLYYIGVRSTLKSSPDLDTNYRSSSKYLKAAIKEIGHNNFSKKILGVFETRELAVREEIKLHNLFDVAKNPLFYNKSKQTTTGFDTSGNEEVKHKIIQTRIKKDGNGLNSYQRVGVKNSILRLTKVWKNDVGIEAYNQMKKTKLSKIWKETIGKESLKKRLETISTDAWKQTVGMETKRKISETKLSEEWKLSKGYEVAKKISKYRIENKINKGKKHHNASKISIFNNHNELMFESFGSFIELCAINNLPEDAFKMSYRNNTKLYQSSRGLKMVKNTPNEKFIGWYAIKSAL